MVTNNSRSVAAWLRTILLCVAVFFPVYSVHAAAPDVSTSCSTVKGSFDAKQNGKTLKCTSKKTCKTTTCKMGVGYDCSVTTTNTLSDCTEVTSTPSAGSAVHLIRLEGEMVAAPTKDEPKRFPSQVVPNATAVKLYPASTTPTPDTETPPSADDEPKRKPTVTVKRR